MADAPEITNDDIIAGWRERHPHDRRRVRVVRRRRFQPTAGLTSSYFERVTLEVDGQKLKAILKYGDLPYGPPTRERMFFAEVADGVPVRVPLCYATGVETPGADGWVLMEALPRGKYIADWSAQETDGAIAILARLHAAYLDCPPPALPRPFTDDLEPTLEFIPGGVAALQERFEEMPHFPRIAGERSLELLLELARRPQVFAAAFARSPTTLLHGDYHRGNIVVRGGEEPALFDWQFACVGPPAYDLAVFWMYFGAVNKPGLFRLVDRAETRPRDLGWDELCSRYATVLRELRPDADVDGIMSCGDAAIAWEAVREITYFARAMEPQMRVIRFAIEEHRTIGGAVMRWLGTDQVLGLFSDVFAQFEPRAERLLSEHDGGRGKERRGMERG